LAEMGAGLRGLAPRDARRQWLGRVAHQLRIGSSGKSGENGGGENHGADNPVHKSPEYQLSVKVRYLVAVTLSERHDRYADAVKSGSLSRTEIHRLAAYGMGGKRGRASDFSHRPRRISLLSGVSGPLVRQPASPGECPGTAIGARGAFRHTPGRWFRCGGLLRKQC
jgi:hypothetical protein